MIPDSEFREYDVLELVARLQYEVEGTEVVAVEVQRADGSVLAGDLVRLHVGFDHDTDRSGGYRWVKITAREET